ncbi:MAG TPA: efflux RND transporter periplasmic adaptor subunit [Vicinamibacterales bacterium]|nr:efflux RND transporter periplasmic adaptor subunit [Vicinamibacterales bacterium]
MRKTLSTIGLIAVLAGGLAFQGCGGGEADGQPAQGGGGARGPGGRPGGGGAGMNMPMTVELTSTARAPLNEKITIVGNLIGAATVDVAPKVSGRLASVSVRLGDSVRKGQVLARVEDHEIRQQVLQAEASYEVGRATIRQREADLELARTNSERSRSLFERKLIPQQTLDDTEARHQAAVAQLDLARAQFEQAKARLDELRINLSHTVVVSPVDGFVGRRNLDPGAFVSQNAPVASVVDIHFVRLVVNLVEKDIRRVGAGMSADVGVDAFPGEVFKGKVARVAPVLDPATRTAQMEIEVMNPDFRLKPGMYARVEITVDHREQALVVPRNAVVDIAGRRGVFLAADSTAQFREVKTGLQEAELVEIVAGLADGEKVVTTGAAGLKDGDRIVLAGQGPAGGQPRQGGQRPGGPRSQIGEGPRGAASPAARTQGQ